MTVRPLNLRIPGPTVVPEPVLEAMKQPMVNHRGSEFKKLSLDVTDGLKVFFETAGDVLILSGSGTAGLETAVTNFLSPGERTLHVVIGNFGQRFRDIARAFGADAREITFANGQAADTGVLRDALAADPAITTVFITHNETSTGVTNPLQELAAVAKDAGKLVIVDGVSSVSSVPCSMDDWGLDVVVSGSQKGWMIPPGLTFVAVSAAGWKAHANAGMPRYERDLTRARKSLEKGETPWTPAISLFFALQKALEIMLAEGRGQVYARHRHLGQMTRDGVESMGLTLLADRRYASNTVTAAMLPEGHDPDGFRKLLQKDYNVILQGGQADLTGKIFRIGHLGWVHDADIQDCLDAMRMALSAYGVPAPAQA